MDIGPGTGSPRSSYVPRQSRRKGSRAFDAGAACPVGDPLPCDSRMLRCHSHPGPGRNPRKAGEERAPRRAGRGFGMADRESMIHPSYSCPHCRIPLESRVEGWQGWVVLPGMRPPGLPPEAAVRSGQSSDRQRRSAKSPERLPSRPSPERSNGPAHEKEPASRGRGVGASQTSVPGFKCPPDDHLDGIDRLDLSSCWWPTWTGARRAPRSSAS